MIRYFDKRVTRPFLMLSNLYSALPSASDTNPIINSQVKCIKTKLCLFCMYIYICVDSNAFRSLTCCLQLDIQQARLSAKCSRYTNGLRNCYFKTKIHFKDKIKCRYPIQHSGYILSKKYPNKWFAFVKMLLYVVFCSKTEIILSTQ